MNASPIIVIQCAGSKQSHAGCFRLRNGEVGDGRNQLLPGLYEYRREGDKRVPLDFFERPCKLVLNQFENGEQSVEMPFGEPFTFQFYGYHNRVDLQCRTDEEALYRIGD